MDIHKPKPFHNLKELASEIVVIVIGILIALSLEQAIEALHSRERAHETEKALNAEIEKVLVHSAAVLAMEQCTEARLAALRQAIVADDRVRADELLNHGEFTLIYPWFTDVWAATKSTDASEAIGPDRLEQYSGFYAGVEAAAGRGNDYYIIHRRLEAMTAPGAPRTPEIVYTQLRDASEMAGALHDLATLSRVLERVAQGQLGVRLSAERRQFATTLKPVTDCKAFEARARPSLPVPSRH